MRENFRYLLGFFAVIILLIVVIFLIVGHNPKPQVSATTKTLDSYANTDATVEMTIDGPVNADQTHHQIQIVVGDDTTTIELLQGYDGQVVNSKSYPNNVNSYSNFLHALSVAGYTKGDTSASLKDERGYCPEGDRYIFELDQDDKQLQRFWSTSCGSPKSYQGNTNLTIDLFEAQVPDFGDLTDNFTY
jgi:hypothetical protein